jgi:hypothetical protein
MVSSQTLEDALLLLLQEAQEPSSRAEVHPQVATAYGRAHTHTRRSLALSDPPPSPRT